MLIDDKVKKRVFLYDSSEERSLICDNDSQGEIQLQRSNAQFFDSSSGGNSESGGSSNLSSDSWIIKPNESVNNRRLLSPETPIF